jgi:hypothetical protein
MNALTDRNIAEAWENGGEVDGKKITDEDLLAHFRDRRDKVATNDPLWEYYDNLLRNYEFNIADSKMTLQYAQEKVSDTQMAVFYEQWATKFPTDSEAYRNTMRTAAAYRSRAAQVAAAGAARARAQAYQNALTGIYNNYQRDWNVASTVITRALRGAGVLAPNETLDDMRASGETNVEHDFSGLLAVFDTLSNSQDPYYVTLRGELEAAGLGGMSYTDFLALGQRNQTGWSLAATTADQYDDPDNARKYREEAATFGVELAFVEDADEWTLYERRRQDFLDEWTQPGLSQQQYRDIANRYARDLQKMLPDATSPALHGALSSEISVILNPTKPVAGQSGVEQGTGEMSDLMGTLADLNTFDTQIAEVRSGTKFFSNTTLQANGTVTPDWTVVDPRATANERNGMVVMMQQGAVSVPVWITFADVRSVATTGVDPESLETTSGLKPIAGQSDLIGKTYVDPVTGLRKWGVYGTGGVLTWFDQPPFELPSGSAPGADTYTIGANGSVTISWAPEVGPQGQPVGDATRGEYDPDSIINDDWMTGGDEIAGKFTSPEHQYYMGSQNGRLALLNTTDAEFAQTLRVRGIPDAAASARLVTFYEWKIEAATVENDRMADRREAQRAGMDTPGGRRIRLGLMEGSVLTRDVLGEEFVVAPSPAFERAKFITERDRLRAAAETFLTANGFSNPQNTRLLRQMTPKEITDWMTRAKNAVLSHNEHDTSRWIVPGAEFPQMGGLLGPGLQLPSLGATGGTGGGPGGGGPPPPTIIVPKVTPTLPGPTIQPNQPKPTLLGTSSLYERQASLLDTPPPPPPRIGGFQEY